MARKVRIEYAGACYHVINRGNYRSSIFESEGARKSFLDCLFLCSKAKGWYLHAWCLMGNHYHLLVETPEPNLVMGMKWLQSTFAIRFNRFRKANGHVFQGRYKAILLEDDALGAVCHYIHLNPVRAGLIEVDNLQAYVDSSFHQLWYKRKRWPFFEYSTCLETAGRLSDNPRGKRLYRDYLAWLSTDNVEQKQLGFEKMSRGWAQGSKEFKQELLKNLGVEQLRKVVESEASEMREFQWETTLNNGLNSLGKTDKDLRAFRKGDVWKVSLARYLREAHLVPYRWIAQRLSMGAPSSVQSLVSNHRRHKLKADSFWRKLKNNE